MKILLGSLLDESHQRQYQQRLERNKAKIVKLGNRVHRLFFYVFFFFFLNFTNPVIANVVTENGLLQGDQTQAEQKFHEGMQAYIKSDHLQAYKIWKKAEANNHPKATFNLGRMWLLGQVPGSASNQNQAFAYFKKSANLGYEPARRFVKEPVLSSQLKTKPTTGTLNHPNIKEDNPTAAFSSVDKERREDSNDQISNQWLKQYSNSAWVIQIFSSQDSELLKQMIRDFSLKGKANILSETVKGQKVYKLIYGQYVTEQQALNAKESLPERLRIEKSLVWPVSAMKNAQKR